LYFLLFKIAIAILEKDMDVFYYEFDSGSRGRVI